MWGKGWDEPYSPPVLLSLMGTAALSDGDVENPCLIGQAALSDGGEIPV